MGQSEVGDRTSADIYRFDVDPDSDTAAAYVLRLVGHNKRVLEIGAGPGSIARPIAHLNKCRVTALELDPKCIPLLEEFCERVVQGDLNSPTWPSVLDGAKFDVIVIADVLEHLVDPWKTLGAAASLLEPDGYIVSSIPNASHAVILACFATNDVEYREWGLLDRTHIRFFGVANLQELFRGAGLRIVDALYVVRPPDSTEFAERWQALPGKLRQSFEEGAFAQVYQTVVKATLGTNLKQDEFCLVEHPPRRQRAPLYYRLFSPNGRVGLRSRVVNVIGEDGWRSLKRIMRM